MEQHTHKSRLICNSSKAPDIVTMAINASSNKSSAPSAMLSKWYIYNAFYLCNLRPLHVTKFAYVITLVPYNNYRLICIDLVLPMGWVNFLYFFCFVSNTVTDNVNAYVLDPTSPFAIYPHKS